jgi:hypothetical protein
MAIVATHAGQAQKTGDNTSGDRATQTNGTPFDYTGPSISGLVRNGAWESDRKLVATKDYPVELDKIFTPQTKKGIEGFTIPEPMINKDPQLIELVIRSESMKDDERQYWFNLSEVMNTEQVEKLRDILVRERIRLTEIDHKYGKTKIDPVEAARKAKEMATKRARDKKIIAEREQKSRAQEQKADDILDELFA